MTWLLAVLLSWLWAGTPLAQLFPVPGPGRAAAGGGGGSTQLAADTFPGANGALGANWSTITGENTLVIVSTAVQVASAGSDGAMRWSAVTWPNDQYAQVTLVTLNNANVGAGPVVRASAATNTLYRVTAKGPFGAAAVVRIEKFDATGTYSNLTGNVTVTLAANDVLRLSVTTSGGNAVLTLTRNGTTIAGPFTDSTAPITSGQAGMAAFADAPGVVTDAVLDNWSGGSIP